MGTWISDQSGTPLNIEYCRNLDGKSPLPYKPVVVVPTGGRHFIKSSSLDVCRESRERPGWREFRFSIGGGRSLTLPLSGFKNYCYKNFECIVFRIGPENVLTYTTLERTKCRIYNNTETTLLIKNYFVYNVKTGAGSAGTFNVEILPGKSYCLKFSPSHIDWNAGQPWEQLEFHFSTDGHEPIKLPLSEIGTKEYVCLTGPGGFEIKPKEDHCCSCWP